VRRCPRPACFQGDDVTLDAGLTLKPTPGVSLALVGYNLTNPGHALLPLVAGGGLGYGQELFSIDADVLFDFTSYDQARTRFMTGAELLLANAYPLRAGYVYDEGQGRHAVSVGLGYIQRTFSLDFGFRSFFGSPSANAVFIGFNYHLEGMGIVPEE
jgi:hypothetical protein